MGKLPKNAKLSIASAVHVSIQLLSSVEAGNIITFHEFYEVSINPYFTDEETDTTEI